MRRLFLCVLLLLGLSGRAWAASCGDGALEVGEQCDDGNTSAGDGCDRLCQFEPASAPMSLPASQPETQPATQPDSQPAVSALGPASAPSGATDGERLQGLWRSTRVPLALYPLTDPTPKEEATARRLSRLGTFAGYAVLFAGFIGPRPDQPGLKREATLLLTRGVGGALAAVGPSAGHLYVGERAHAVRFSTYRAMMAVSAGLLLSGAYRLETPILYAPGGLAAATLFVFTVRDMRDGKRAARRHTRAREAQRAYSALF